MFRRLRAVFQRHTLDREMRDEMDAHLDRATDRLIARGMSPEAARLEARREFGNVGVLHEEARDIRGARWVESLVGDVRFALRHFRRRPLYAFTIVAVLSLGLGSHAAVFAFVQALTTRPAPGMPDDESLVQIRGKRRTTQSNRWVPRPASGPEWRALSELRETFTSVAAWRTEDVVLRVGDAELPSAQAHFVSDNYFSTLGLTLKIGGGLPPSSDVGAIISNLVWERSYGGTPDVIGKTIDVNGVRATIVGVAPAKFHGAQETPTSNVVWMSLPSFGSVMRGNGAFLTNNDSTSLLVFGRLVAGVTPTEASAAVRVVASRAIAERPRPSAPTVYDTDVVTMIRSNSLASENDGLLISVFFESTALLVLLITCTNVSALIVGSAVARRHEIAVRLSLGASRPRVVRQLVTENTLLALGGAVLGVLLYGVIAVFAARYVPDIELAPDWKTFALTTAVALGTGILFGLSPALNATRRGVADVLKDSGSGHSSRSRMQRVFVIAQIALTQPLLVGLAMVLGLIPLTSGTMANNVDQRLMLLSVPFGSVNDTTKTRRDATQQLIDGLRILPGVVDVIPDAAWVRTSRIAVHPNDVGSSAVAAEPFNITVIGAHPRYFKLIDMPIVRGRDLIDGDVPWQAVVIASDVARRLWNGGDPIGKRFQTSEGRGLAPELVVVGVYDARYETTRGGENQIFVMQDDRAAGGASLIRTAGPAAEFIDSIRATVRRTSATEPIGYLGTIASMREAARRELMLASSGAAGIGILMLLLASLGLYGVVALAVGQRRREIGIRMALGARAEQVVGMFFAGGVRTSMIGLAIGLPLSIVALRALLVTQAPEISATHVGAATAIAVLTVAALATWIPARRAATINPVSALKAE